MLVFFSTLVEMLLEKVIYSGLFLSGSFVGTLLPQKKIRLTLRNLYYAFLYYGVFFYKPMLIKKRESKLREVLIKLSELFQEQGCVSTSIWFLFKEGGRLVYEYGEKQETRIYTKQDKGFLTDFIGDYFICKKPDCPLVENTLVVPKLDRDTNQIYFHININCLSEIQISNYQLSRVKQLIIDTHILLTNLE